MPAMAEEVVRWATEDGATGQAAAEVVRYSPTSRLMRSIGFVTVGLVGGLVCLIVPVLHLITTWGLPLLGIVLGMRAYRTEAKIFTITGPCPGCAEPIQLAGGAAHELDASCPECEAKLMVELGSGVPAPAPAPRG